jgi:transcriptional regulator with XRE-family HTH domain
MTPTIGSTRTSRKPRRYLDPRLAAAIRGAKEESGMSWREIGRECGVSHSFLIQLAHGKRVPSTRTAGAVVDVLDLERDVADELMDAAAPMWLERDRDAMPTV